MKMMMKYKFLIFKAYFVGIKGILKIRTLRNYLTLYSYAFQYRFVELMSVHLRIIFLLIYLWLIKDTFSSSDYMASNETVIS
jgi:hypothetical protein